MKSSAHIFFEFIILTKCILNDEAFMDWQHGCKIRFDELKHYILSHYAIYVLQVITMALKEHVLNRFMGVQYYLP